MCFNQTYCDRIWLTTWCKRQITFFNTLNGGVIKVNNVLQFDFTSNCSQSLKNSHYGLFLTLVFRKKKIIKSCGPGLCKCTLFILNKHSTSLSNTFCILRPFEDRKNAGWIRLWAMSARNTFFNLFNTLPIYKQTNKWKCTEVVCLPRI